MKRTRHIAALGGLFLAVLPTAPSGASPDFDRYATIIARQPFGTTPTSEPAPATAPVVNVPPAAPMLRTLRMCAVTRSGGPGGELCVGLVDAAGNRSYYLAVGETDNDVTVIAADYDAEKALVRKGGEQSWLQMNAGPRPVPALATELAADTVATAPAAEAAGQTLAVSRRNNLRTLVPEYAAMRRRLILESASAAAAGQPPETRIE